MPAGEENVGDGSELFRALNDRIRQLRGPWAGEYDFVCECSDETCTHVMRLSEQEYEFVLSVPDQFAVVPGHEDHGAQEVVASSGRYLVVRKRVLLATE
jgi:hypothetical protein